jgi:hypothetical protein
MKLSNHPKSMWDEKKSAFETTKNLNQTNNVESSMPQKYLSHKMVKNIRATGRNARYRSMTACVRKKKR